MARLKHFIIQGIERLRDTPLAAMLRADTGDELNGALGGPIPGQNYAMATELMTKIKDIDLPGV